MMSYWIVAAICMVFAYILVVNKKMRSKNRGNLPPGPPALPIIGNLHQLGPNPHRSLLDLSRKYGPTMYLRLGSVPTVVVSTPESVREVLKTFDVECCTRPHLSYPARLTYNFSDLAFSPYNEYWRELRKLTMLELYTAKRVQSFGGVRREEVGSLVELVKRAAASGSAVNFNDKMMSLSGGLICRIGFGMNLRGSKLGERYEEVVLQAMRLLGSFPATDFFPYVGWVVDRVTGLKGRCEAIYRELDEFYEQAIEQHLEKRPRRDGDVEEEEEDIIDLLLKMQKEQLGLGKFRLTRNHIKGILVNILLAGIDTSAQTVTWVMTHLIRNPHLMKKVQAHVRDGIKNKDNITEEDFDNLDYLKLVIKETFRINPPVPFLIPREAAKDVHINGYLVPKKTRIQVNIWAIHRNPDIWKDPERFVPERFADSHVDYKGQNFEYLPFGSGRRMCPGMGMGMALVHLTLMNLLYRFDWKLPEGMKPEDVDAEEVYGLVAPKKIPLELIPIVTQWT